MSSSGGGSSAPAPDPAIGQAALKQAQTGQDMLDFFRQSYNDSLPRQDATDALARRVTEQQLTAGDQQMGIAQQQQQWAAEDRARTVGTFRPLEDAYITDASNWDSPARQEQVAAAASSAVRQQGDLARDQTLRGLTAAGVNPASGRFAGIERSSNLATGLAAAGAGNLARDQVRTQGVAMRESAINLGRGLAATAAQSTSAGLQGLGGAAQTGGMALNNQLAAAKQANANTGLMAQGFQGAMAGYQGQAQGLNGLYNSQVNAWSAGQQAGAQQTAGIGSAIGSIAGIAAVAL